MILLDTSILSQLLRRAGGLSDFSVDERVRALRELVVSDQLVVVPGIVAQEILSGIRSKADERAVSSAIDGYPILLADLRAHREAARVFTECRAKGVSVSHIDCLIAAQAILANAALFTSDADFDLITKVTDLRLHEVPYRAGGGPKD